MKTCPSCHSPKIKMENNEFKIMMGMILIIIFIVGDTSIYERKRAEDYLSVGDWTFNKTMIEKLKYEIRIDCKWVSEHLDDTTIYFPNQTIELCQDTFPDLDYSLEEIKYEDFCYYPPSCYDTKKEFLSQFPNQTPPYPTICYYAIYCDGRNNWGVTDN